MEQLKTDINYLRTNLENKHPNLYLYIPKTELDHIFDSLTTSISTPMTELTFYKHLTVISAIIKDGHTLILPSNTITTYHNKNSNFLPYHLSIFNDRLFVDMVCSNDTSLTEGSEIISINSIRASDIITQLSNRQVRDGNNLTYPTWILNNYLREYYSFIFGHPDQFTITYKSNNIIKTSIVSALPKDHIYYFRQLKYPTRTNERKPNEGITLAISQDSNYTILSIKDFHNDILKKEYHQNFKKIIPRYFEELYKKGTENLILDLRNNQGGDILNGTLLLSYLLDKPFSVIHTYYKVDSSKKDFSLKETGGRSLGIFNPKEHSFKGKLYVLINGGSFSNSGIVAACLKRNNRAIFIGEETGGNNKVLAGDTKDLNLPNTHIQVQIPTKQYLLDKGLPLLGQGTIPDYIIQPDLINIITGNDTIMNYAKELIRSQNEN